MKKRILAIVFPVVIATAFSLAVWAEEQSAAPQGCAKCAKTQNAEPKPCCNKTAKAETQAEVKPCCNKMAKAETPAEGKPCCNKGKADTQAGGKPCCDKMKAQAEAAKPCCNKKAEGEAAGKP